MTDVFTSDDVQNLDGYHAIGHTRYSTAGGKTQIEGFQVGFDELGFDELNAM